MTLACDIMCTNDDVAYTILELVKERLLGNEACAHLAKQALPRLGRAIEASRLEVLAQLRVAPRGVAASRVGEPLAVVLRKLEELVALGLDVRLEVAVGHEPCESAKSRSARRGTFTRAPSALTVAKVRVSPRLPVRRGVSDRVPVVGDELEVLVTLGLVVALDDVVGDEPLAELVAARLQEGRSAYSQRRHSCSPRPTHSFHEL